MSTIPDTKKKLRRIACMLALYFGFGMTSVFFGGSGALAALAPSLGDTSAVEKQQSSVPHMNVWCVRNDIAVPTGAPCNNALSYTSVAYAVSVAGGGDEIRLQGGSHTGAVSVDKPLIFFGGFTGNENEWGNPRADCLNQPSCTEIEDNFTVISNFEVFLNGISLSGTSDNTHGGTITAFGSGIRLGPDAGTYTINGRWNIAAPAHMEIVASTQVAQVGTQIVGDGWLTIFEDGVLKVEGTLDVLLLSQHWGGTRAGHIDGPGTLNVTSQYIWECGEMRGTGVTNLMPGATMNVPHTCLAAPGFIDQRTFNNQGTIDWDIPGYALSLNRGATFNNNGTFNLTGNTYLQINTTDPTIYNPPSTFNNSSLLRSTGAVYRQVLKPSANVVFNNTGNIDVPDAGGTLHFLQGTFNLQNGTTLTGAGVATVGPSDGTWNVTGTVNARNVIVLNDGNCTICGIAGPGTLNISGNLEWQSGMMFGSGVTNLLAGASGNISGYSTLDTRTFNNQGTINFLTNGRLYFSNAAVFNNTGSTNSANDCHLFATGGHTGTFNNTGTFNKLANHDCRVWAGATFLNSGTLNITGPTGFGMHGGQFRQTGGVTNISSGANLWSNDLAILLEGGAVRGTGSIDANSVNNTGAEISPGSSVGIFSINGNYTQGAGGRLNIQLGGSTPGTGHDQLVVNGAASLGGMLNVILTNGYNPPAGTEFSVASYQSHTGNFSTVTNGYTTTYNTTALILTATGTACTGFSDVPQGSTYFPYVTCLADRSIVNGYSDCTFRPGNPVTRGQLSKIVTLAANFTEPHSEQTFEDVPVGSTFHLFVERLASRSIISGYVCGGPGEPCGSGNKPYFRTNSNVTRGQTSKIVAIAKGLPAPPAGQQTFEDVPTNGTFWTWIEELSTAGAISGYACGGPGEPCVAPGNRPYFRSANNVTRGQSTKIVATTFFPNCQIQAQANP